MDRRRILKSPWFWIVLGLLVVLAVPTLFRGNGGYSQVPTSVALAQLESGNYTTATVNDREQTVDITLKNEVDGHEKITSAYPTGLVDRVGEVLDQKKQPFETKISSQNIFVSLLISLVPILLVVFLLFFIMNSVQGGGSRVMNFGKSKAKLVSKDTPKTTFADVAGADEAIEELQEIKEFLENPAKFQAIGAKIPKGVLLYGPPGTGKTLLARAVAGEAGVPFYSISGSDFVEMFVGVGASRVRDLFEQAKSNAPAIIFVDEIDAVGRHRGAGLGGGHDEREQTLNQLLVEMDGFDVKGGVILIAATNRPDILDPALLRPGRFDRQIAVDRPDLEGRRAVLAVHAKGKPLAPDIDLSVIARRTPGFTGADLANVINEAALLTARQSGNLIHMKSLEEAIDRVIAGPERRTRAMSEKEKKVTAYHEGGHALVAWALPNLDPVHKVTILPRGRSLGHTLVLPTEDRYTQIRSEITDQLVYALGGRAAEELVFHEPTTGASNDIEKATRAGPRDDHRVRDERQARGGEVRPEGVRAVPRPRLRPPAGLLGDRRHRHRQRGQAADRDGARRGLGDPGRIPGRPRRPGARADGEGDAGQGGPGPDLRPCRQAAAAQHVRGVRPAGAVGQAAGDDAGRVARGQHRPRPGQRGGRRPRHALAQPATGTGARPVRRQRRRPARDDAGRASGAAGLRAAAVRDRPVRRRSRRPAAVPGAARWSAAAPGPAASGSGPAALRRRAARIRVGGVEPRVRR